MKTFEEIATLLKRSAVVQTIKELVIFGLLKKYKVRKKDGSYSDNHYKVVALKPPKRKIMRKKRRSRLALGFFRCCLCAAYTTSNKKHKYIINQISEKVNTSPIIFFSRGSPKICRSLYSTHFYTNRKKNKIKLYLKYRCNLGQNKKKKKAAQIPSSQQKSKSLTKQIQPAARSLKAAPKSRIESAFFLLLEIKKLRKLENYEH